jgi:hypothetical protein
VPLLVTEEVTWDCSIKIRVTAQIILHNIVVTITQNVYRWGLRVELSRRPCTQDMQGPGFETKHKKQNKAPRFHLCEGLEQEHWLMRFRGCFLQVRNGSL